MVVNDYKIIYVRLYWTWQNKPYVTLWLQVKIKFKYLKSCGVGKDYVSSVSSRGFESNASDWKSLRKDLGLNINNLKYR